MLDARNQPIGILTQKDVMAALVGTPPAAELEVQPPEALAPVRGKRILVVDDEPEVASLLAEMLSLDGHEVETASNGALALEKLRKGRYDLIVSDSGMPVLDGPGLYREVERLDPRLARSFIFLTGDTLNPRTREFLEGVPVPRLSKPFALEEVRRLVQRVLRGGEPTTA
ncbi:MAG: response regulator [Candidatus Rokubacteria bacterium]|nr:response regulator [Candidatus Rokubacteria bacterium]